MKIVLFILVAVMQLGSIGWMLGSRELVLRKGQAVRFVVEPIDPYDPFRGRYVALGIAASRIEDAGDFSRGDSAYALIEVDPEGYATLAGLQTERPEDDRLYLKVQVSHRWRDVTAGEGGPMITQVELPFDRYYMNEHEAPEAERIYREAVTLADDDDDETAARENYLVVKILKGRAVAQQLVLRGEPL